MPSPDPTPTLRFRFAGASRQSAELLPQGDGVHRRLSPGFDRFLPTPGSPRGRSQTGSTSPCGCSTRSWRQADCSPTNRVARRPRPQSSRTEVERLHWRIWNGKAKNAQKTFDRIRKVMHLYKGERGHRTRGVASRKLWHALHEIDKYLRSQSTRLVNYAARYRAGMRVGTAVTEGTANFPGQSPDEQVAAEALVSARRQRLVLQVRCAVYNGTLGSGFGQRFRPHRTARCHNCQNRRVIPPVSGHSRKMACKPMKSFSSSVDKRIAFTNRADTRGPFSGCDGSGPYSGSGPAAPQRVRDPLEAERPGDFACSNSCQARIASQ